MTEYHGYLDRFTIVGQCLIAEGWANEQDFKLWYDDVSIPFVSTHVPRPDLAWAMDGRAQSWGFSLCAAIPFPDIQAARFQLRLNAGMTLVDPANCFSRHEDHQFEDMTARFRDEVAQKKGSLLEIGSRARSGNLYRGWFPPDIRYVGLDVTDGPNVDIVGDAHHLSRHINEKVDFIYSIAVFEHILMPWKVAIEMNKVMKPDGLALIISHNAWPLHEEPWDFLRFSTESWAGFFNRHTGFTVLDAQYQNQASIVPQYASTPDLERMSEGGVFLTSGCLVKKTGEAAVDWNGEVSEVYDLGYSYT